MLLLISCMFMFYLGMITFFSKKSHILMLLLVLEFLSLTLVLLIMNFLVLFMYDIVILIYFIIVLVCEAVMGLVLLTLIVRTHGSDYFKSSSMLMC
uniref:NADH-ubiquinone oxidoreductase chain 4L n=1 Tax=Aacanthocnema dobsoni TaxID=399255 RepID=A0A344A212_9HEMI|nr:NADH dehydrogenase subunit 4L [Aacanthocnema dobsoni]AWU48803.1 NADH dehydrogenase subunit 4L [Aacanthocnema dobsoni]